MKRMLSVHVNRAGLCNHIGMYGLLESSEWSADLVCVRGGSTGRDRQKSCLDVMTVKCRNKGQCGCCEYQLLLRLGHLFSCPLKFSYL